MNFPACTLTLLLLLALPGCKNDEQPEPKDPVDWLPPPTQEGLRTFGALVNGRPWVSEHSQTSRADYSTGQRVVIYMSSSSTNQGLVLSLGFPDIEEKRYEFIATDTIGYPIARFDYHKSSGLCRYDFEHTLDGHLTINKFDKINGICTGTFEYTAVNDECDTVRITDGRFDTIIRF